MCGISCANNGIEFSAVKLLAELGTRLRNRGPDKASCIPLVGCTFCACVLRLRGFKDDQSFCDSDSCQPLLLRDGVAVLCWNGELFHEHELASDEFTDTALLGARLSTCNSLDELLNVLSVLQGPGALVWANVADDLLLFGRDVLEDEVFSLVMHRHLIMAVLR